MADCARYEPTIDEILADPTVKALMKADRVNPDRLQTKLRRLGRMMELAPQSLPKEARSPRMASAGTIEVGSRQLWG